MKYFPSNPEGPQPQPQSALHGGSSVVAVTIAVQREKESHRERGTGVSGSHILTSSLMDACSKYSDEHFICTRESNSLKIDFLKDKMKALKFFPTFKKYNLKQSFLLDLNAALVLTAIIIPQCMAYAILAKMPPVIGVYASIAQPLIYCTMGTTPFVSFGTFALVSMLVGDSVDLVCGQRDPDNSCGEQDRISIGASLSLVVGCLQIIMMIMNFGKISLLLDQTVVRAFTTAIAFHIASSQLRNMGFDTGSTVSVSISNQTLENFARETKSQFALYSKVAKAAENLDNINYAELTTCLLALVLLLTFKHLNNQLKKKWKYMNLPIDFIIVFCSAIFTQFLGLAKHFSIHTVGQLPMELPNFPPGFQFSLTILSEAAILAVISISMHLSFINVFSDNEPMTKKSCHSSITVSRVMTKNEQSDQEILAAGLTNFVCAWFSCYPGTVSLSRSVVLFESESTSQLSCVLCSCFVAVAFVALRSTFQYIPLAVLAAVIFAALKKLFMQFRDIHRLYKASKQELAVWLITFLAALCFSCEIGLIVGFSVSVLRHMIILNSLRVTVLINSKTSEFEFEPMWEMNNPKRTDTKKADKPEDGFDITKDSSAHRSIAIVYVRGPINCITVEKLMSTLNETLNGIASENRPPISQENEVHVVTDDGTELLERDELQECFKNYLDPSPETERQPRVSPDQKYQKFLILDTGHVSSFDHLGMLQFMTFVTQIGERINLVLACDQGKLRAKMRDGCSLPLEVFPNSTDAVTWIRGQSDHPPDVINCSSSSSLAEHQHQL